MKKFGTIVATALVLCGAVSSTAAAQTWNFVPPSGDLGGSYTFTDGYFGSVVVSTNEADWHLYGKDEGPGNTETGLGICYMPAGANVCTSANDYELFNPHSLYFNLTGLTAGGAQYVTLGSVQAGENYSIYGSTDGITYSLIASGNAPTTLDEKAIVDISGNSYLRFDVPANGVGGNNYLVNSITVTPEPASMALLATGLVGVFGAIRRRRAA